MCQVFTDQWNITLLVFKILVLSLKNYNQFQLLNITKQTSLNIALIAEIIRRHHYCESVSIVGGEFKPNEFKSEWVHIDDHHGKPMGIKVDNTSLGQLGVHISQSNEVSQRSDEDSNSASNRPLQRVRKGYRLSSKCWD